MSLEDRLSQDLKAAMLAGQQQRVMTLRGLKSSLLYAKVANKSARDEAMPDEAVIALLARESKKRQESADLYRQGGSQDKADAELQEKAIIDAYLPAQLTDEEIVALIDTAIAAVGATGTAQMGQVIGKVKQQAGATADGAVIARLVKEKLSE
jgi:uncharacterized protein YqeY